MEEKVDILDEFTGQKTGEIIPRSEAHRIGKWHGSIHLLIINKDKNKTLIQKRAMQKKLYPNMWDISVAGHILSGEDDLTTVKRELEEELGIKPSFMKLEKVDKITEKIVYHDIINNEYVTIFIGYADIDIKSLKLQKEEVSQVKWCTKEELNLLLKNNEMLLHVREYEILNEILS